MGVFLTDCSVNCNNVTDVLLMLLAVNSLFRFLYDKLTSFAST